jgi:quinol monooxygenase YgiN
MEKRVGFCVIYRFKVRAGSESSFRQGWSTMTEAIREHRGGLGSRLHIDDDGWWVAYAQWPDRESWARARDKPSADADAAQIMSAAIEERLPPILMEANIDLLVSP